MPAITIVTDSGQSDEGYGFKPLSSTVMAGINAASLGGKNCTLGLVLLVERVLSVDSRVRLVKWKF